MADVILTISGARGPAGGGGAAGPPGSSSTAIWKDVAVAATTGPITIAAPGGTIDGVTMASGNRFLVKDQAAPAENGLYTWTGAGSAAVRATDMDATAEFTGGVIAIAPGGVVNGNTHWKVLTNAPTVGTTAISFEPFIVQAWKQSVKAASTANITLTAPGAAIDGVTMVAGDRFLAKNQTVGTENGVYIWTGAATTAIRAPGMSLSSHFNAAVIPVMANGTVNGKTKWFCTNVNPTIGTTAIAFESFTSALETAVGGISGVTTTLSTYAVVSTTQISNFYCNSSGTQVSAAGYANSLTVLTGSEGTIACTAFTVGAGNNLAVFFSDAAGTTFLSGSSQHGGAGGTQYTDEVVTVPAAARAVRVNGTTIAGVIVKTLQIAPNIAARLATQEGLGLTNTNNALTAWGQQTLTIVANANVGASGVVTTGVSGYAYTQLALTGLEKGLRVTTSVTGSTRALAYFFTDTACTTFLSQSAQVGTVVYNQEVIVLPPTARGVRINGSNGSQFIVEYNQIDPNAGAIIATVGKHSEFKNAVFATIGDSVTAQGQWQTWLFNKFQLKRIDNFGVAGTRIAYAVGVSDQTSCMCDNARINALASDTNVVIMMGGINDFGNSIPIGSLSPAYIRDLTTNNPATSAPWIDPYTFYGACEQMILKMLTKFPGLQRILWASQTYIESDPTAHSWSNRFVNLVGKTQWDYRDAVKAVAEKWGIPFVDMITNCGWSTPNISTFIDIEPGLTAYIHPNAVGGKRMASVMLPRLIQLAQIDVAP